MTRPGKGRLNWLDLSEWIYMTTSTSTWIHMYWVFQTTGQSVMGLLFKPNATVAACTRFRPIHIDVDFWMTQWAASSITDCFPSMHKPYRFFRNEFHCTQWVWLKIYCRLFKSRIGTETWTRPLTCRPCAWIIGWLLERTVRFLVYAGILHFWRGSSWNIS